MRKVLIGLAVIVVLAIAAVILVPSFLDWNQYKPEIIAAAKQQTGRDLAIDGDLRISVLPAPALSVAGIRLGSIPGASVPDLARIEELEVRVALAPLLGGTVKVESIRIIGPAIVLERLADGRANWEIVPPASAEPADAGSTDDDAAGAPADLSLDSFEIVGASLRYLDAGAGIDETIGEINLAGAARSLQGPFNLKGSLFARGLAVALETAVGALDTKGGVPLNATLGIDKGAAKVSFTGTLSEPSPAGVLAGKLKARAAKPGDLLQALAGGGPPPAILQQAFSLDGAINASAAEVTLNDLSLEFGETQATGAISAALGEQVQFDAAIAVGRIDLDQMLQALAAQPAAAASAAPAAAAASAAPAGDDPMVLPAIPEALNGTANLNVDGIAYNGGIIRQMQVSAALEAGRLSLTKVGALMPGGSSVNFGGIAQNTANGPTFDGKLEFSADNLRGLLAWAGAEVGEVPPGRLGNLSLTSNVRIADGLLQVYGVNLRLDATSLTGGLAYRLQSRPSFGLDVAIDKINLDGYLPMLTGADAASSGGGAAPAPTPAAAGPPASPLAVLESFDGNVKVNVGRVTLNQTPIDKIAIDVSNVQGILQIRELGVGNLAGLSAKAAGSARDFINGGAVDLGISAAANSLAGVARLAALELPVPAERLGKASLSARLKGSLKGADIDGALKIAGAALELKGAASDLVTTKPAVDLVAQFDHPSLAQLSRTFDLGIQPLSGGDAPIKVRTRLKGALDIAGPVPALAHDIALRLDAAAATLRIDGTVNGPADNPNLDATVRVENADLVALLRGVGVDYQPRLGERAGVALSAKATGTPAALAIRDLKGGVGPITFQGTADIRTDGARPYVGAKIEASEVVADVFLAAAAGGGDASRQGVRAGQRGGGGGAVWSEDPIDLGGMSALDADIDLRTKKLQFKQYPFIDPRLIASLRDGVLTISQLTGSIFEGAVDLKAQVNSKPVPAFGLSMTLDGTNLGAAMRAAVGLDTLEGRLGFNTQLQGIGATQMALVRSLQGKASVNGGQGLIRGFDFGRINRQLGDLDSTSEYLNLLKAGYEGGETAFTDIRGTFDIQDGIARTRDLQVLLDGGQAAAAGDVSLPDWRLNMLAQMTLAEHRDPPPMRVTLYGPLDAPQHKLDRKPLEQWAVRRFGGQLIQKALGDKAPKGLGNLLGNVLGGGTQQPQQQQPQQQPQQPQQQQPQQQQPSSDPVQGLLRGLLGRKRN